MDPLLLRATGLHLDAGLAHHITNRPASASQQQAAALRVGGGGGGGGGSTSSAEHTTATCRHMQGGAHHTHRHASLSGRRVLSKLTLQAQSQLSSTLAATITWGGGARGECAVKAPA